MVDKESMKCLNFLSIVDSFALSAIINDFDGIRGYFNDISD